MEMAKVTSKGQITIPISIRRRLEINEGDKILFINKNEGVMMVNPDMLQSGQLDELSQSEPVLNKKTQAKPSAKVAASQVQEPSPETAYSTQMNSAPAQPVAQPVVSTLAQPAAQPMASSAAQPLTQPVASPVTQPVAQPVVSPVAQPVVQPAAAIPRQPRQEAQAASPPASPSPDAQSGKQIGGLDLSSLLDDIRSIGSNV